MLLSGKALGDEMKYRPDGKWPSGDVSRASLCLRLPALRLYAHAWGTQKTLLLCIVQTLMA